MEKLKGPEIIEVYKNYMPSVDVKKAIENILQYTETKYLKNLESVILTNSNALSRVEKHKKVWSRNHKCVLSECLAFYKGKNNGKGYIKILVNNMEKRYKHNPKEFIRDYDFSIVFYHELGHHLKKMFPEYSQSEDYADKWSEKLTGSFLNRKYWHLKILYFIRSFFWQDITKQTKKDGNKNIFDFLAIMLASVSIIVGAFTLVMMTNAAKIFGVLAPIIYIAVMLLVSVSICGLYYIQYNYIKHNKIWNAVISLIAVLIIVVIYLLFYRSMIDIFNKL